MKKKIYIVPQTIAVNVQLQHLMAGSGGNRLMQGEANASGEVLSRQSNSDWFDDDED